MKDIRYRWVASRNFFHHQVNPLVLTHSYSCYVPEKDGSVEGVGAWWWLIFTCAEDLFPTLGAICCQHSSYQYSTNWAYISCIFFSISLVTELLTHLQNCKSVHLQPYQGLITNRDLWDLFEWVVNTIMMDVTFPGISSINNMQNQRTTPK